MRSFSLWASLLSFCLASQATEPDQRAIIESLNRFESLEKSVPYDRRFDYRRAGEAILDQVPCPVDEKVLDGNPLVREALIPELMAAIDVNSWNELIQRGDRILELQAQAKSKVVEVRSGNETFEEIDQLLKEYFDAIPHMQSFSDLKPYWSKKRQVVFERIQAMDEARGKIRRSDARNAYDRRKQDPYSMLDPPDRMRKELWKDGLKTISITKLMLVPKSAAYVYIKFKNGGDDQYSLTYEDGKWRLLVDLIDVPWRTLSTHAVGRTYELQPCVMTINE